jgi:ATP/maltotriose-dependent transcriptional regulator MalT
MLALASELGNPLAIANTRVTLGAILLNLGELDAARQHGEHVRSLIDSERLPAVFAISSCCLLAPACAHLGLLQQARAMVDEALARAATYGVPYLRAHATNFAAQTYVILRDVTRARSLAEETLRLASEYGFSVFRISATMVRGWCDVEDGRVAKGLAALRGQLGERAIELVEVVAVDPDRPPAERLPLLHDSLSRQDRAIHERPLRRR